MKTTGLSHFRQGDVLIERIVRIPATAAPQKPSTRIILAHGEATGHHHALETTDPADWWITRGTSADSQKPATLAGALFVVLLTGGRVSHQEHADIQLPPGNYRITRQREYSPGSLRNVAD